MYSTSRPYSKLSQDLPKHQVWHHTNGYKHRGMCFCYVVIVVWGPQPKPLCGKDPERNSAPGWWNKSSPSLF